MDDHFFRQVLIAALALNATGGFAYRTYRLTKGGPLADVIGQAILGVLLVGLAVTLAGGMSWPRWPALGYGLVFGLVVMPIWVMGVLIPLRPTAIDYGFTAFYWASLAAIVVSALLL